MEELSQLIQATVEEAGITGLGCDHNKKMLATRSTYATYS